MTNELAPKEASMVDVIQSDEVAAMTMLDHAFRNAPEDCLHDVDANDLFEAFARHRIASARNTRTEVLEEAANVAENTCRQQRPDGVKFFAAQMVAKKIRAEIHAPSHTTGG